MSSDIEQRIASLSEQQRNELSDRLRDATVGSTQQRLVLAWRGGASKERLAEHLRERLPAHMQPQRLIHCDEIPRTLHGKINYKALNAHARDVELHDLADHPADTTVTLTDTQAKLSNIVCDVLSLENVDLRHRFFDIGGDSLSAMRVMARMKSEHAVNIAMTALILEPMNVVADAVDAGIRGGTDEEEGVVRRVKRRLIQWLGPS